MRGSAVIVRQYVLLIATAITIVAPAAVAQEPAIVISQFRTQGPGGAV